MFDSKKLILQYFPTVGRLRSGTESESAFNKKLITVVAFEELSAAHEIFNRVILPPRSNPFRTTKKSFFDCFTVEPTFLCPTRKWAESMLETDDDVSQVSALSPVLFYCPSKTIKFFSLQEQLLVRQTAEKYAKKPTTQAMLGNYQEENDLKLNRSKTERRSFQRPNAAASLQNNRKILKQT